MRLIIRNGLVVTMETPLRILPEHSIIVEDGKIEFIAPEPKIKNLPADQTIDAGGSVVLPGFINAHTHFYSAFARGAVGFTPSSNFQDVLRNVWWRLDRALTIGDCVSSAAVTMLDGIRHGVTTFIDHHSSPSCVRGSLAAIGRCAKDIGVRAVLCYEVSDRDGEASARQGIEENIESIESISLSHSPLLRSLFGLHASFTLGDETLRAASRAGHQLNTGFHIHVAESKTDQQISHDRFGKSVVQRLDHFGILGNETIAAHCVNVDTQELELLAKSGTIVVLNPQSNLNNAVGIPDLAAMRRHGISPGLGTDAMTNDMITEARVGLWSQHHLHRNPSFGFQEIERALFRTNAEIASLSFGTHLGVLERGADADIIIVDHQFQTPVEESNIISHLLFGEIGNKVSTTIIRGNVVYENGDFTIGIEPEILYEEARRRAAQVWARM